MVDMYSCVGIVVGTTDQSTDRGVMHKVIQDKENCFTFTMYNYISNHMGRGGGGF